MRSNEKTVAAHIAMRTISIPRQDDLSCSKSAQQEVHVECLVLVAMVDNRSPSTNVKLSTLILTSTSHPSDQLFTVSVNVQTD